jgi:hypothetical protein
MHFSTPTTPYFTKKKDILSAFFSYGASMLPNNTRKVWKILFKKNCHHCASQEKHKSNKVAKGQLSKKN